MIRSSKPRKQRKFRFNAPLHERQHFTHAHLDKALRAKLGIKRAAVQICKGDTVKVMEGSKKGTTGKVTSVSLRSGRITLDSLIKKNAKAKEFGVTVHASNVYITDLNLKDKYRANLLKVSQAAAPQQPAGQRPKEKEKVVAEAKSKT